MNLTRRLQALERVEVPSDEDDYGCEACGRGLCPKWRGNVHDIKIVSIARRRATKA